MSAPTTGAASPLVRYRWGVLALWLLVALALGRPASLLPGRLVTTSAVPGSESARVQQELAGRFASPFAQWALLVVTGAPAADGREGAAVLAQISAAVERVPGVTRTLSHRDAADSLWLGRDGTTFLLAGLDPPAGGAPSAEALVPALRAATVRVADSLRAAHPRVALRWTGEPALNADLRAASAADVASAERRVLPLTLLVLVVAFGAVVAALVPVAAGALSIAVALGLVSLVATRWPVSPLVQNVVVMLGLGLGVDYALLAVSRFREERLRGAGVPEAAQATARRLRRTVWLSAAAVAIGFAALLLVPLRDVRSLGVGGLLVTAVAALVATTFVPALLAVLGARVDGGRLITGSNAARWRRWGAWVVRRPVPVLVAGALPLLLLAHEGTRLRSTLPSGRWLPEGLESARALAALDDAGRGGAVQALRVVLELPAGTPALSPAGWLATRRLADTLAADRRVARVRALPRQLPLDAPDPTVMAMLPAPVLRAFVSADGGLALVELLPASDADAASLVRLVGELRALDAARITGLPGASLRVGGLPAVNADHQATLARWTPWVVGLVVAATMLALAAGFRSLLLPVKAVLLNLLAVGAAFGAVVLVIQDGHGAWLVGLDHPLDGTFAAVPLLVFCTVFGLSMDYEVFLLARVAEARAAGLGEADAVAEGLARSGGVITSAAALMVLVFGAFTLGQFALMKILGLALATAVLADATLIRMAVAPALLRLAGRWNWWPGARLGDPAGWSRGWARMGADRSR